MRSELLVASEHQYHHAGERRSGMGRAGGGALHHHACASISHNVDFCWDPIPSRPCGSNLYQSVANVFRYWYFYPVLAGEMERRRWVQVILIQHLVASDCRFISERNHRVPLKAETGA